MNRTKPAQMPAQSMGDFRRVAVTAITVFVVVSWWASSVEEPASANVERGSQLQASSPGGWPVIRSETRKSQAGTESPQPDDAEFGRYVAAKYRFLFLGDALSPDATARVRAALVERETIAVAINTARQSPYEAAKEAIPEHQAQLAALERKIGTLLPAADLAAFEALRDSDIEQFQLEDFAGGIENIAPLKEEDKQAILYAKLAHRQRFRQLLEDSGLRRSGLGTADRQFVLTELRRALKESKDGFLAEARQYLHDEDQYTLLSNYENSEFTGELAKLRAMADGG